MPVAAIVVMRDGGAAALHTIVFMGGNTGAANVAQ